MGRRIRQYFPSNSWTLRVMLLYASAWIPTHSPILPIHLRLKPARLLGILKLESITGKINRTQYILYFVDVTTVTTDMLSNHFINLVRSWINQVNTDRLNLRTKLHLCLYIRIRAQWAPKQIFLFHVPVTDAVIIKLFMKNISKLSR